MTSETQRDPDDFVTYDDLEGPDLDPALWRPLRVPLPTGGERTLRDPDADVTAGDGIVRVAIPRFSVASDTFQPVGSAKYAMLTTHAFALPPDRPAVFAADMAVENIAGEPGDYRQGMAAFQVTDLTHVFSVIGTATRVFAMHEQLGVWGADDPFVHVIESPYEDFGEDFTRPRACEITFDRAAASVVWRVDGHQVYKTHGTAVPERLVMGMSIWTQLPIRGGRSRSLQGQGLKARWGRFRVRGASPAPFVPPGKR